MIIVFAIVSAVVVIRAINRSDGFSRLIHNYRGGKKPTTPRPVDPRGGMTDGNIEPRGHGRVIIISWDSVRRRDADGRGRESFAGRRRTLGVRGKRSTAEPAAWLPVRLAIISGTINHPRSLAACPPPSVSGPGFGCSINGRCGWTHAGLGQTRPAGRTRLHTTTAKK